MEDGHDDWNADKTRRASAGRRAGGLAVVLAIFACILALARQRATSCGLWILALLLAM